MNRFELPKLRFKEQDPDHPWWTRRVLWMGMGSAILITVVGAVIIVPSVALPVLGLACGGIFFLYGMKYYGSVALILLASSGGNGNGNGNGNGSHRNGYNGNGKGLRARVLALFQHSNGANGNGGINGLLNKNGNGNGNGHHGYGGLTNGDLTKLPPEKQPFISIQLPMFNEAHVVDRLLQACTHLDYENYEVLVADDSSDMTLERLELWAKHPKVRVSHRINRSGFKGAALKHATEVMNPKCDFVAVFDADFIPPPDILHQFLSYFYGLSGNGNGHNGNGHHAEGENGDSHDGNGANGNGSNGNGNGIGLVDERLAVVQGYQWHVLNASENWITRGIRTEFAGSYVVERSSQELTGGMKMISGSVFMIRADVLKQHEWGTSITEDWELTLRLYLDGYKVLYSPFIQAPAEIVSDFKQLARQRMRWAEGHTYNVKKFFFDVFKSPHLTRREKLEFVYYAPYYLTSVLFIVGTAAWMISDIFLEYSLPFWTDVLGWSLVFTNSMALILMNLVGLFQERSVRRNWQGLLSFVLLTFLLVPYQAYASMKGLLQPKEGGWHRTDKTGVITEKVDRMQLGKRMRKLMPKKKPRKGRVGAALERLVPAPVRLAASRTSLGFRLISSMLSGVLILFLLSRNVAVATAAPDSFYFHNTNTTGITPAGKYMDNTAGSAGSTMTFNTAGQDAYWYTDVSYPTGGDDGSIAAGSYTANLYFNQLPSGSSIAVEGSESGDVIQSDSTPHTINFSVTCAGTNRLLLVGISNYPEDSGSVPSGVAVNGSSTGVDRLDGSGVDMYVNEGGNDTEAYIYKKIAPATGTNSVEVTFDTDFTNSGAIAGAICLSGVDQTTPLGDWNSNTGNSASPASVTVSSATGELVFSVAAMEKATDLASDGTDHWAYSVTTDNDTPGAGGSTKAGATSVTTTWTWSNPEDHWAVGAVPIKPAGSGSVDITVYAQHTATDGSGATTITSASTTITSSTTDPLALDLGSASAQTFTAGNPRLLRAWVEVTGVTGGGSFTLDYDGTCASSRCSSLDTPVVTVPDPTLVYLVAAVLIPPLASLIIKRQRLATRIISVGISVFLVLGILGKDVQTATAAPDTFYLHPTTTTGITPAGEYMNNTEGSGGSNKNLDAAGNVYWYADQTWPTGTDDASIAAGAYTFNMYFAALPGRGTGDYPVVQTSNTSNTTTASTSHTLSLPTGIQSGDLLIALLSGYIGSGSTAVDISWPSGWTEFYEQDASTGTLHLAAAGAYRKADGTEGASITVTTNLSLLAAHNAYRITGAADPAVQPPEAASTGFTDSGGTTVDPPSLTPTGGAKDYLWIASASWRRTGRTLTSGPTNYTDSISVNSGGGASGLWLASTRRQLNASSEDPGVFSLSSNSERRVGVTIAVHPAASVDIQVTVSHTAADGSGATTIATSSVTTIDANTADPLALSVGSGALQTFTSADPRRLRVRVEVISMASGGNFVLDYDGTCASSKCSNLDTPVVTVPDWGAAFLLLAPLVPYLMSFIWKRRRRAAQMASVMLAVAFTLALLARQVDPVSAAPDTFYFHNTNTTGITPAGKYMDNTAGTGGSTMTFDTSGQDAYWYHDVTWPTGADDATIAAGSYTLNMYFNQLPAVSPPEIDDVSSDITSSDSITISHTTTGTELLMLVGVSILNDDGEEVSTTTPPTYNGDELDFLDAIDNAQSGGDDGRVEIWYLVAPDTGTHDLVVTFTANLTRSAVVGVMTFTGVHQTTPLGSFAGNEDDSSTPSVTIPSGANDLVFAAFVCETCDSVSIDSPADEQWNHDDASRTWGAGGTDDGASPNVTISATVGSGDYWTMAGVAVKPAAPSVSITAYAQHTASDGSGATTITSASTTITPSTSDPLALDLGSAALQTFTSGSPRRLRAWIEVTAITGGGSFILDYDGTCATSRCSNLDTPVVVVPEFGLIFAPLVLLIPLIVPVLKNRRTGAKTEDPPNKSAAGIASLLILIKRNSHFPRLGKDSNERRNTNGKSNAG